VKLQGWVKFHSTRFPAKSKYTFLHISNVWALKLDYHSVTNCFFKHYSMINLYFLCLTMFYSNVLYGSLFITYIDFKGKKKKASQHMKSHKTAWTKFYQNLCQSKIEQTLFAINGSCQKSSMNVTPYQFDICISRKVKNSYKTFIL
jgi:hypothetical protein